ncbi:MAG TPA: F0F1 ATP synthase subunit delta [Urbifossiella sp.]|jgi:F-type H+-transporting ATPase subunit delta
MPDVSRELPIEHDHVLTVNVRQTRIARVYSEALLAVAARDNQVESAGAELTALVADVIDKDPKIAAFFTSPAITRKAREPILNAAMKGHASPLVAQFIHVLNRNNRLDLLPAIAAAYRDLLDKRAGRVRVLVRSAFKLSDAQQAELRKTLSESLRQEPVLDLRTDPELLGGLVVQVGDKVYDTSVRSRLEALRNQLAARGSNVVKA